MEGNVNVLLASIQMAFKTESSAVSVLLGGSTILVFSVVVLAGASLKCLCRACVALLTTLHIEDGVTAYCCCPPSVRLMTEWLCACGLQRVIHCFKIKNIRIVWKYSALWMSMRRWVFSVGRGLLHGSVLCELMSSYLGSNVVQVSEMFSSK